MCIRTCRQLHTCAYIFGLLTYKVVWNNTYMLGSYQWLRHSPSCLVKVKPIYVIQHYKYKYLTDTCIGEWQLVDCVLWTWMQRSPKSGEIWPFGGSGAPCECVEACICGHCGALEAQALGHQLTLLADVWSTMVWVCCFNVTDVTDSSYNISRSGESGFIHIPEKQDCTITANDKILVAQLAQGQGISSPH